jgi:hypothetical protein
MEVNEPEMLDTEFKAVEMELSEVEDADMVFAEVDTISKAAQFCKKKPTKSTEINF